MSETTAPYGTGPAKGTTPEGERNVVRKEPAKHPEWYEVEVEKLPSDFSMPDRVQQMLDDKGMGWEIVGSKDAVRVRLRCPYKNYLAAVERGYSQADSRRRRKIAPERRRRFITLPRGDRSKRERQVVGGEGGLDSRVAARWFVGFGALVPCGFTAGEESI